jgi:site-specific DNA-adenine methylase
MIWDALGAVKNYVEPFFGSGAVLLARPRECWATPDAPGTETVNDASRFLANFWRALATDPEAVTRWADWPVNECDLHARHRWLVDALPALSAAMQSNPDHFDAKIAGWWVWGLCSWIGTGWCDETRERGHGPAPQALPEQLPHLGTAGMGLHRKLPTQLPHLGGGRGINARCRRAALRAYLAALSDRLRRVRVACGDWSRVCGDSVTWRHGLTGVLLDPPYAEGAQQYAAGGTGSTLSADVRAWAIEAGKRADMRVVLCGLEGEHEMPASWRCVPWKARGGYGSQRTDGDNENRHRERLWLSPACLDPTKQPRLF